MSSSSSLKSYIDDGVDLATRLPSRYYDDLDYDEDEYRDHLRAHGWLREEDSDLDAYSYFDDDGDFNERMPPTYGFDEPDEDSLSTYSYVDSFTDFCARMSLPIDVTMALENGDINNPLLAAPNLRYLKGLCPQIAQAAAAKRSKRSVDSGYDSLNEDEVTYNANNGSYIISPSNVRVNVTGNYVSNPIRYRSALNLDAMFDSPVFAIYDKEKTAVIVVDSARTALGPRPTFDHFSAARKSMRLDGTDAKMDAYTIFTSNGIDYEAPYTMKKSHKDMNNGRNEQLERFPDFDPDFQATEDDLSPELVKSPVNGASVPVNQDYFMSGALPVPTGSNNVSADKTGKSMDLFWDTDGSKENQDPAGLGLTFQGPTRNLDTFERQHVHQIPFYEYRNATRDHDTGHGFGLTNLAMALEASNYHHPTVETAIPTPISEGSRHRYVTRYDNANAHYVN